MLLSWCGWHMQVLCIFMKNVDMSMLWSIFHHGGTKRVPRQRIRKWCHNNLLVPITHWDTGAKEQVCGCAEHAKDGGVIPDTGFPTCWWHGKRGASQATIQSWCKHEHLIQHMHSFTGVVSGLYLWSMHFQSGPSSERCRGSRRSRDVVEVVVHVS